jgi:dolichol-phosphate mannosyltransferase
MGIPWAGQAIVIVPTYNEKENLAHLVQRLRALAGDIHVLIVDDNSPDGTGAIANRLSTADQGVHVLHRRKKLGLGTAYKAGFAYGLKQGFLYLCTMDADFSHSPENIPDLLDAAASGYDLVVGSRYVHGGRVMGSTWLRQLISFGGNWMARTVLGVVIRDCTAGFRCYRRHVLETIDLDAIFSNGYSFLVEMAFLCQQTGHRVAEVPITFVNRTEGTSKIGRHEIFRAFYTLVRLRTQALPWDRIMAYLHQHKEERAGD